MNSTDSILKSPRLALALSGGGFRASVFHLGVMRRLAELGWLSRVDVLSTVSGGSIVGAFAALHWSAMPDAPTYAEFERHIVHPFLERIQSRNFIRDWLFSLPLLPLRKLANPNFTRTSLAAELYARRFFGPQRCDQLPMRPYLVMNAASLQSIRSWRFTRSGMGDSRIGHTAWGKHPLSVAECAGASAAFPPVFPSPRIIRQHYSFGPPIYGEDPLPEFPIIPLSDGGVYDNFGVEALQKDTKLPGESQELCVSEFLIVSDAGYPPHYDFRNKPFPLVAAGFLLDRVLSVALEQVSAVRSRWIVKEYQDLNSKLKGTFVSLGSHVGKIPKHGGDEYYRIVGPQYRIPPDLIDLIQKIRTNLDRFTPLECQALMYHAYTMTDAFLWAHRATCPANYRVSDIPNPDWRIEFTSAVQDQWRDALAHSG